MKTKTIFCIKRKLDEDDESENPLRNADNRISTNFYELPANQKADYMFTAPPFIGYSMGFQSMLLNFSKSSAMR